MVIPAELSRQATAGEVLPVEHTQREEQALVARIRAGDRAAFDTLVLTYYTDLCGVTAAFVRSPASAEELVQDVFFKLWCMRTEWTLESTLRRYLFGAARNAALVYCRRERMVQRWESVAVARGESPATGVSARTDKPLEQTEVAKALRQAIDRLPARCREVASLRFEQEFSRAEVAEALGITVKAVERQLTRALRVLRPALERYLGR